MQKIKTKKTVAKKDEIDFTLDKCTGTFQALGESAAFGTETQVPQVNNLEWGSDDKHALITRVRRQQGLKCCKKNVL